MTIRKKMIRKSKKTIMTRTKLVNSRVMMTRMTIRRKKRVMMMTRRTRGASPNQSLPLESERGQVSNSISVADVSRADS